MFGKSRPNNIDGFVVRRRTQPDASRQMGSSEKIPEQFLGAPRSAAVHGAGTLAIPTNRPTRSLNGSEQQEQTSHSSELQGVLSKLPSVDLPEAEKKRKRRFSITKKKIKIFFIILALIGVIVGGYVGIKLLITTGRVVNGNLFSALLSDGKELKTDQYGRVNVLIFGTSEDDVDHDGADLADSILIASINPTDKSGYMVSVPRDLWVKYGTGCSAGFEGRINVAYQCGKDDNNSDAEGAEFIKTLVGKTFGMDIQYYAHVNYTALTQAVDAVGGITVQIESDDPRGILDRNFDWKCGYRCNYVKYPNGPAQLDGVHALALARARNAAGGYGLGGGNFDREQYQQKILIALKDKASSAGVLADPIKVTNLLDALGDNVRTNFDAGEVKTLVRLAQEVNSQQLKRISLVDEKDPLVTTGNISGQSIVRPVAGVYDFSEIQSVLKAYSSGDTTLLEGATIDVYNGSGVVGVAQTKADEIETSGFSIGEVGNVPVGSVQGVKLYDLSDGKMPGTKAKLLQQLGLGAVSDKAGLPSGVITDADFVIILGSNGSN